MTCALAPNTPVEKRAHCAPTPASLKPVESISRTASAILRRRPRPDWASIASALGAIRDSIGAALTYAALAALGLGLILLACAITAATIHITTVAARHRRAAVRGLAALTAVST